MTIDIDTPKPDKQIGLNAKEMTVIAGRQVDLAEEQYADSKKLSEEFAPLFKTAIEQSITDANTSRERGDAQWESYTKNFAPLEAKMAQTAANYDTKGRRTAAAQEAVGDVATRFQLARDERNRVLSSVNAGSGKALAFDNAARIEQAKAEAGGANKARKDVEMTGLSLVDNAAKFGRNMPSTGIQTAALSSQQTNQATNQVGGLQNLAAAPAQGLQGGLSGAVGSYGAANAGYMQDFSGRMRASEAQAGFMGDLIGAGAGAAGMIFSSKRFKHMGGKVDGRRASKAVEDSPSQEWQYRPGLGDGDTKRRIGPTAEDLAAVAPEVSDGTKLDTIAMMGLHHAAIGDTSSRIARIERAMGLSDAEQQGAA